MSDNISNRTSLEMLELVAAVRAVLTVAKAIQERVPDAPVEDIAAAVDGAITLKLAKLKVKGYSKLSVAQKAGYKALSDAQQVIPQVQAILLQARSRTPEEIAAFVHDRKLKLAVAKEKRDATPKKVSAKTKAAADAVADQTELADL